MITYDLQLDLDRDASFANADGHIGDRLLSASWVLGMPDSFSQVSQPLLVTLAIHDPELDFSQDKAGSPFGAYLRDMLVRVRATVDGHDTRTLFTGWITDVRSSDSQYGVVTTITVEDKMLQLQDAEYLPMFSTGTRVDTEIRNIFDTGVLTYPYQRSYWLLGASRLGVDTRLFEDNFTVFETALTELAYAGDAADRGSGVSALGYIMDLMQAEKGGRFFVNREGKFEFHNRFHDVNLDTGEMLGADEFIDFLLVQGEAFNDVTVNYTPRSSGAAGSVMFAAQNLPMVIYPGTKRTIVGRYYDPDVPNATVGGMDMIEPVPVTDYAAQATVGGQNITSSLRWQFELGGTAVNILIHNPTDESISVTKLQVRGTPVITYQQEQARNIDVESIYNYGRIPLPPINARFINTEVIADGYAKQLARRYNTPDQRYEWIECRISSQDGELDNLAERLLSVSGGDALYVTNTVTGHGKNYAVVGEQHTLFGLNHQVRLILRPTNRAKVWILGQHALGTDTILAF